MSAAPGIVLATGAGTFANEWLQTGKPNWRVVPATLLASWGFSALDKLSEKASISLAIMVAIVGVTTTFGGKSIIQELGNVVNAGSTVATGKRA
jgi:hypothetical protein